MSPRTHLVIGVVYLLLGGALIATSFGWNPFGSMFGAKADEPRRTPTPPTHPVDSSS